MLLPLILLAFGSICFASFIVLLIIRYKANSPEAQLQKRLYDMIQQAEEERAKRPKIKKNVTPVVVDITQPPQQVQQQRGGRRTFFERVIRPMINSVNERFQKLTPDSIKIQLEDKIFRAGKLGVWDIKKLVSLWCLSIFMCTFMSILMLQGSGVNLVQRIFFIGLGIFMGAMVPFAILNSKIRERQRSIRRQLPEFLDILCVSVQAGLSFDGAVGKMLKRMHGPLIDEFQRAQNDVALGMTHEYALSQLARRCDLEEVYLFTTSVIQAEKLGTSMTRTLKLQADNMRERHRQYVKAEALKAPVKIIFPMVLFIFPSIFVVLLFPAMLTLIRAFGGG